MSRKFSIRIPNDLYVALDREAGEYSLSSLIIMILQQCVGGLRPKLSFATSIRLHAFSVRRGLSIYAGIQRLLSNDSTVFGETEVGNAGEHPTEG
jgi:hypothetical protein